MLTGLSLGLSAGWGLLGTEELALAKTQKYSCHSRPTLGSPISSNHNIVGSGHSAENKKNKTKHTSQIAGILYENAKKNKHLTIFRYNFY